MHILLDVTRRQFFKNIAHQASKKVQHHNQCNNGCVIFYFLGTENSEVGQLKFSKQEEGFAFKIYYKIY